MMYGLTQIIHFLRFARLHLANAPYKKSDVSMCFWNMCAFMGLLSLDEEIIPIAVCNVFSCKEREDRQIIMRGHDRQIFLFLRPNSIG